MVTGTMDNGESRSLSIQLVLNNQAGRGRLNPGSKQGRRTVAQGQPLTHKGFRPAWGNSQKEKQKNSQTGCC